MHVLLAQVSGSASFHGVRPIKPAGPALLQNCFSREICRRRKLPHPNRSRPRQIPAPRKPCWSKHETTVKLNKSKVYALDQNCRNCGGSVVGGGHCRDGASRARAAVGYFNL